MTMKLHNKSNPVFYNLRWITIHNDNTQKLHCDLIAKIYSVVSIYPPIIADLSTLTNYESAKTSNLVPNSITNLTLMIPQ